MSGREPHIDPLSIARASAWLQKPPADVEAIIRRCIETGKLHADYTEVYGSGILVKRCSPDWHWFEIYVLAS